MSPPAIVGFRVGCLCAGFATSGVKAAAQTSPAAPVPKAHGPLPWIAAAARVTVEQELALYRALPEGQKRREAEKTATERLAALGAS